MLHPVSDQITQISSDDEHAVLTFLKGKFTGRIERSVVRIAQFAVVLQIINVHHLSRPTFLFGQLFKASKSVLALSDMRDSPIHNRRSWQARNEFKLSPGQHLIREGFLKLPKGATNLWCQILRYCDFTIHHHAFPILVRMNVFPHSCAG